MTTTNDKKVFRLDALPQRSARLQVDRTFPGAIRGVSLITTGPADGHGFDVDPTTVEQVSALAAGLPGRWTHGSLCEDGLGRHLGRWSNIRPEPFWLCRACNAEQAGPVCATCRADSEPHARAIGDFLFARSAHQLRPDGLDVPAPEYLMDRAEEDPQSLGISVVARFTFVEPDRAEGAPVEGARLARVPARGDLLRADWVADPAANPVGLHAGMNTPSELTEGAIRALDRLVARDGKDKAKTRALAFLARYFGDAFGERDGVEESQELETFRARVDALTQEVAELRAAASRDAAARREAESEALLVRLRAESTAMNAPIPAEDLGKVQALLAKGDLVSATVVGEAFLSRSRSLGQTPFQRGGTHPLGDDHDSQRASVAARVRMLRRRGWRTEVSADGTEITKETPPRTGA